jgi:hypothetical protein
LSTYTRLPWTDADREVPEGGEDLAAGQPLAVGGEHGDRVAAGVDRVEQAAIELQRALGREVVDDRAVEHAAEAAGAVAAGLSEAAVGLAVIGDDRVPGRVVGLDENRTARWLMGVGVGHRCSFPPPAASYGAVIDA